MVTGTYLNLDISVAEVPDEGVRYVIGKVHLFHLTYITALICISYVNTNEEIRAIFD